MRSSVIGDVEDVCRPLADGLIEIGGSSPHPQCLLLFFLLLFGLNTFYFEKKKCNTHDNINSRTVLLSVKRANLYKNAQNLQD